MRVRPPNCPARSCISATAASSSSTMAAAWQAYRWNSARPNDSSIRLGSIAHTCTHPDAIAGSSARISDQITEPFPDPVAPAISTCVAASRSRQGEPSSQRPDRQRGQVHLTRYGQGADRVGEGVGADQLQDHHAGGGGADAAQPGAERVRQVLRPGLEVGRGLPGHQPGPYQVARPRPGAPCPGRGAPAGRGSPARARPGSSRPSTGAGRTTSAASPAPAPPRTARTMSAVGPAARPGR